MNTTIHKAALLDQIERERLVWEQLLRAVGEERMEQPGAAGAWSFKDVVAHLNGWRVRTLARLDAARTGAEPAPPPWPADLDEDSFARARRPPCHGAGRIGLGELARKLGGNQISPHRVGNLPGDSGHQPLRGEGDTRHGSWRETKPALAVGVFLAAPGADHAVEIDQQCSGHSHGAS